MRPDLLFLVLMAVLAVGSCVRMSAAIDDPFPAAPRSISLSSPAFAEGQPIPKKFAGYGDDISPPLAWLGVPQGARSLAFICEDPDAPMGTFCHWIVLDLPPTTAGLPEDLPKQPALDVGEWKQQQPPPRQGTNDFGRPGYGGPKPPSGTHRYVFRIFALDATPTVGPKADRKAVLRALEGHVIAQGRLIGTYTR
jgi:Raf kinase inhibitor-like YbhB/YbcL family protein